MPQAKGPQTITPREFAANRSTLRRSIPVAHLPRLADVLAEVSGELSVELHGGAGSRNEPLLTLQVTGVLLLTCQRCLEPVGWPLDTVNLYELRGDVSQLSQDDLEDDSRDYLAADESLDVRLLVEDEVLLNLPFAPRHEDCQVPGGAPNDGRASPFSVLAALKKDTH